MWGRLWSGSRVHWGNSHWSRHKQLRPNFVKSDKIDCSEHFFLLACLYFMLQTSVARTLGYGLRFRSSLLLPLLWLPRSVVIAPNSRPHSSAEFEPVQAFSWVLKRTQHLSSWLPEDMKAVGIGNLPSTLKRVCTELDHASNCINLRASKTTRIERFWGVSNATCARLQTSQEVGPDSATWDNWWRRFCSKLSFSSRIFCKQECPI